MQRIRTAMGRRDDRYNLEGFIEMDEGYFSTATPSTTQLKRGRGSQAKGKVAVMAESTPLENIETGKKESHFRYAKMKVVHSHNPKEINKVLANNVNKTSVLITDRSTSYSDFSQMFETHISEKSTKEVTKTTLKWVHIAISNAKRNLLGIYHMINKKYLQYYLDEFCYRLNRRYFGKRLFNRLIIAVIEHLWYNCDDSIKNK